LAKRNHILPILPNLTKKDAEKGKSCFLYSEFPIVQFHCFGHSSQLNARRAAFNWHNRYM